MTKVLIRDPANPCRDGWHSITDYSGAENDSLNGNIKMVFLSGVPQTIPTNTQRQPDDWSCGAYALAECLNTDGESVRTWLKQRGYITSAYGTAHEGIVKCLNAHGYSCSWDGRYYNGQMHPSAYDDLVNHLQSGKKAIILFGGLNSSAGGRCRNSFWSNAGHYCCAYGVEGTTGGYMFNCDTVQYGSVSNSVKLVQRLLNARYYKDQDGKPLVCDGECGDKTVFAIKAFQANHGLTADGIAGEKTLAELIEL